MQQSVTQVVGTSIFKVAEFDSTLS